MGAVQSVEDVLLHPAHWTAALPAALRQVGVADLLSPIGLAFESYGTARMMARSPHEERRIVGKVDPPPGAEGGFALLECLPSRAVDELEAQGLSLRAVDASMVPATVSVLKQAWCLAHAVWPELSSFVGRLVRCVHLLEAPSSDVDCSYSRPDLPFSVFLSVPGYGSHARIERVTEALVHETMHLQLSLLERRIPLVDSDRPERVAFSPWRNCERNVLGVLHALYVFVMVRTLWQRAAQRAPRGLDRKFAEARVRAVRDEVGRAQLLAASPGLTYEGRHLVRQLLALGTAPIVDAPGVHH